MRVAAEWLSPDSPEFQARANRPLSERGASLARYHEERLEAEQRANHPPLDEPKTEGDKPAA